MSELSVLEYCLQVVNGTPEKPARNVETISPKWDSFISDDC
jgi:hypothetical protein